MSLPTPPDWGKLAAATHPTLTPEQTEALRKIWGGNYERFAPLKQQLYAELDPEFVVDPAPDHEA